MAGIPLKSGADFYVLEAARMRLHNLGADPTEYGDGLIYFNNSDGNNTSRRARIYDGTTFRSLAYLDEIANNEAFNALVGRVDEAEGDIDSLEGRTDALEALFSGSNAKVADNALMLGGQLPSYYAQSSVLAQLRSEFDALYKTLNDDTTGVIDTWQEVVDFVNEYSGSEDLSTILAGMNTQIADRYTKAEADGRFLKLTGGTVNGNTNIVGVTTLSRYTTFPLYVETVDPNLTGVGIRFRQKGTNTIGLYADFTTDMLYRYSRDLTSLYTILDTDNYSDLITTLNNTLSVPSITIGGINLSVVDGTLKIDGNAYATGELAAGGAGEEGSDDMGLALLENWADYDATKAQALGAVLGKDMYDRVVTLEGKSTNVQFTPTLSSGKQIGAITIDGVTTGIFAPSSYAWSEIDGRPTSLSQFTDDVVAGNYLPLIGGVINGNLLMTGGHLVTHELYAGADNTYDLGNSSRRWANIYTVLINEGTPIHSGNVGEYNSGGIKRYSSPDGILSFQDYYNSYGDKGISMFFVTNENGDIPAMGTVINFGHNINRFGRLIFDKTNNLYWQGSDSGAWLDRKTIAFTDSNITGNAATATLASKAVQLCTSPTNLVYAYTSEASAFMVLGRNDYTAYLDGSSVVLRYGQSLKQGIILNSNGNVTIGASDLAGSDYKLYVNGKSLFTNTITANAGINLANRTYIRGMLTDGTTNALLLGINQSDNFLVGYGVMTAAQTSVYGKSITMHANGEAASFRINEYGNVTLGISTDRATDTYGLYVGKALPSYFVDRALINGVADDGSTALALRGALKVCRTTSPVDTFLEVTSNDTIVKYMGYDSSDGFCSHDFYSHDKLLLHISATNATSQFYTRLAASGLITASGGLYIPTGQSFKIGEATLSWDADKNALKVDKNIYSDGEVSAGGAGEEGESESTGNASAWAQTFTPTNTTMPFEHNRATTDVIVQVYEKNDGGSWDMILVDVEIISETKVNLHFGRTENREHKIVIMG